MNELETVRTYLPRDRRQALTYNSVLPDRARGAAMLADISGFTPLTSAFLAELGERHGPDTLTAKLNVIYEALIERIHHYGGSIIGFSGDGMTCWFDEQSLLAASFFQPATLRAITCGLALQTVMGRQFTSLSTPAGETFPLALKVAISNGPVRRFQVGDPEIQLIDILAGQTVTKMAEGEACTKKGEVVVTAEIATQFATQFQIQEWRTGENGRGQRFAVISHIQPAALPELTFQPLPYIDRQRTRTNTSLSANPLPKEVEVAWLLPQVYKQIHNGQERFLAEIRPAVALFLRFNGPDYDKDIAARQKLNSFIQLVQSILAEQGGQLLQVTMGEKGDYLYGAFGAPIAYDDAPLRAATAAREILRQVRPLPFIEDCAIGISQGLMRTGAYGGRRRRTYGVLGHEVNIASRLMMIGQADQILITHSMAEAVQKRFRLNFVGRVEVKGQTEPLPVYQLWNPRPFSAQRPATFYTRSLIGRQAELATLDEWLAQTQQGQGQVISMAGGAGVGKSHLTAEFVELAIRREFDVAIGTSQSTTQSIPYIPWRQIFRTLFNLTEPDRIYRGQDRDTWQNAQIQRVIATLQDINPAWIEQLPLLKDVLDLPILENDTTKTLGPQSRQQHLHRLLVDLLQQWARKRPLLFLIEDVQWLDEASYRLLLTIAQTITTDRICLAFTYRPFEQEWLTDVQHLPYSQHLTITELDPASVLDLLTHRFNNEVSSLLLMLIQNRAQGNAFYIEESLRTLIETEQLDRDERGNLTLAEPMIHQLQRNNILAQVGDSWTLARDAPLETVDLGLPETIQKTVLARLDRLPPSLHTTIKVASVLGHIIEPDLLDVMHPDRPGWDALLIDLEYLALRDLLRRENSSGVSPIFSFKHNITQEVVYETLTEKNRRTLHRIAATALEHRTPQSIERIAHHYRQAKSRRKAVRYLAQAATKARQEYANVIALSYYDQALEFETRWQWQEAQIEIYHLLGQREKEWDCLQKLEANPTAPAETVALLWKQYHEATNHSPNGNGIERH